MRSARFFPQARLNYAENLLAGGRRPGARDVAVVALDESGVRQEVTWEELQSRVATCQRWLVRSGVAPGDHVAAWLPNGLPALVTMLAAVSIGAVFTSTSPDFGVSGVVDRFAQVSPVVLVAADGYRYGGKRHGRAALLADVVAGLPTVREVAVVPMLGETLPERLGDAAVVAWDGPDGPGGPIGGAPLRFGRTGLRTPGFVLYSSGTTGKPKCIVHSGAGILLKQLTEHQLHCDIRPGDTVFYYTTTGWMMWNWLVTALASGATVVLYDGSPFHPGPTAMWDLAAAERVTLFGTSAKFIDACAKAGVDVRATHDLSGLRTITSTGSPLSAEGFAYVYDRLAPEVHLASISGGTDLCGCFVLGDPTRAVFAGEIQGPALGTAADVWDDGGHSLVDRPGVRGELVCTAPFPSMPVAFAGDDGDRRYSAAYFERFPGVWAHGDFASRTEHGGFVIHGRSDATLNAGGVRIGTAEIYRQVDQLPEVAESLAIGQEWDGDTRIVLFLRLADPAAALDQQVHDRIRSLLRSQCSPRHVPARIIAVADLPRTRSGKLAELAVSDVVHRRPVRNTTALANPESLALFADLAQLRE
jgi:acetoacetyl-CoA synthetase